MPSFRGEVKLSVPCRRFAACKRTLRFTWTLEPAGKIDWPFLAQFRPSLTQVSHVAWHEVPLEMTDGTKGGAQWASSLRPRCFGEVDPKTAIHSYLYLYTHPLTQCDTSQKNWILSNAAVRTLNYAYKQLSSSSSFPKGKLSRWQIELYQLWMYQILFNMSVMNRIACLSILLQVQ
jgi:hypothetical protein